MRLDLCPEDLDRLRLVLKSTLPGHARVYAFGPRASGLSSPSSSSRSTRNGR
jgi:hypothetical protein